MAKKLQKSNEYSDFFNNLIDICTKRNTTPTALAEKFAHKSVLTAWKNGKIETELVSKLSLELNVSIDYLITGAEKNSSQSELTEMEQELLTHYKVLPANEQIRLLGRVETLAELYSSADEQAEEPQENKITIKHSLLKVSAGTGNRLDDEFMEEIEVTDTPETRRADFCLTITGNSMEPVYYDGDIVLVKKQAQVELGQIGIFIIEGAGYIKKCGGDRLISLNEEYEDILLSDYSSEDIVCSGLVIGRV